MTTLCKLEVGDHFFSGGAEFILCAEGRAVCGSRQTAYYNWGETYTFPPETEVVQVCLCGSVMISDALSAAYGDYCPQENCRGEIFYRMRDFFDKTQLGSDWIGLEQE